MVNDASFSGTVGLAPGGIQGSGSGLLGVPISAGGTGTGTWASNFDDLIGNYTPTGYYSGSYHSSGHTDMKFLDNTSTGFGPFEIDLGRNWSEVCNNLSLMVYDAKLWNLSATGGPGTVSNSTYINEPFFVAGTDKNGLYPWGTHLAAGAGTYTDDSGILAANIDTNASILGGSTIDHELDDPWAVRLYIYNHFLIYSGGAMGIHAYNNPFHCKLSNCSHGSSI